MKKLLVTLLALTLLLASCGGNTTTTSSADNTDSTEITSSVEDTSSLEVTSSEATSSEETLQPIPVDLSVPLLNRDLSFVKRVKILPMGDSFTEFYPAGYRFYLYENLYRNGNFFEFVGSLTSPEERLGSAYTHHEGTSGHKVSDAIEMYKTRIKDKVEFDVLICFYGINDVATEENVPDFKSNYRTFLDMVTADNPETPIYLVGAPKEFTANATKEIVEEYKQKGVEITYINMYQRDDVTFDQKQDYLTVTAAKGHANDSGNFKFAGVVFDAIKDKITELNKKREPSKTPVAVKDITLSAKELTLDIGEEYEFTYEIYPNDADTLSVKFYTSDPNVANIDRHGLVTANKTGEATITVVSLDGKAVKECKVTVTDKKFEIPKGEKVFEDKFVDAELWEGDTRKNIVEPKHFSISATWSDADVKLTTLEAVELKDNFTMEFKYCTFTYLGDTSDENYMSLKLGNYEVRFSNNVRHTMLYANGQMIGECKGFNRIYKNEIYSLCYNNGTATLYRGNFPIITVKNAPAPKSGKIYFNFAHRWSQCSLDNLRVYTE